MFLKDAYHQYQLAGTGGFPATFDLVYTKANETFGQKHKCKRLPSVEGLAEVSVSTSKHRNRQSGKWYLWHPDFGEFEIHACGIISFNGHFIDHRF